MLDAHEAVQRGVLLWSEAVEDLLRVHGLLALVQWEQAQMMEAAGDGAALVRGELVELLHGVVELLALRRSEALHGLGVGDDALALGGRHGVELDEALLHALLLVRRELLEAGLGGERGLLLGEGLGLVRGHPLAEVLLQGLLLALLVAGALGRRSVRIVLRGKGQGKEQRGGGEKTGAAKQLGKLGGAAGWSVALHSYDQRKVTG
jgi:hypothetical protein